MHKALALIALIALPALSALAEEWNEPRPGDVMFQDPAGGALNARTGKYYPPTGPSGVIDPETGAFFPKAGLSGFTDPKTRQYYPAE